VNGATKRTVAVDRPPAMSRAPEKPKLYIATPCYGGQCYAAYVQGLVSLCCSLAHSGFEFEPELLANESLVTRARNKIVASFLRSNATHLLFIDADVGFHPRDVDSLMKAQQDVVCGAYPMKNYGWESIADKAKAGAEPETLAEHGALYAVNLPPADVEAKRCSVYEKNGGNYVEVMDAATGFLLISRGALERFIAHYGKSIEYTTDYPPAGETHWNVFHAGIDPSGSGRYLSEDYHFSRMWQQMGGKIYLCLDCKLTHSGTHMWRGDITRVIGGEPAKRAPAPSAHAEEDDLPVEIVSP
jgi:hypothetical protein